VDLTHKHTFLNNFANENFGKACDNLGDWLGDLLTKRLLNDLRTTCSAHGCYPLNKIMSYLSDGLLGQSVSAIRLEALILFWTEVVH